MLPPILGDQEVVYGCVGSWFALAMSAVPLAAMLIEVMMTPSSRMWLLSLATSTFLSFATRTGLSQHVQLRILAIVFPSYPQLARLAAHDAVYLAYVRSLGSWSALIVCLSIGGLRAVTFGDARAIVWLDANDTVPYVILGEVCGQLICITAAWLGHRRGLIQFTMSSFAAGHPLGNVDFRTMDAAGYAFVYGFGCAFVYAIFVTFLGAGFVTGQHKGFDVSTVDVWVLRVLSGCAANGTLSSDGTTPLVH
jgi:hypothetical protein